MEPHSPLSRTDFWRSLGERKKDFCCFPCVHPKAEEERSRKKQPDGQVRQRRHVEQVPPSALSPLPSLPRVVRNASDSNLGFPQAMWAAQPCVPAQPGVIALGVTFLCGPSKFSHRLSVVCSSLVGDHCFTLDLTLRLGHCLKTSRLCQRFFKQNL
uniref:Uncharacterized protein n=1 Tax=Micrurus spixii TaxID=129469 RepID=A0A2D4L980_9SAUR